LRLIELISSCGRSLLAVVIGWGLGGAVYGLFVALRLRLAGSARDNLLLMAYVGLAFFLLGAFLLALRGLVRLVLGWLPGKEAGPQKRTLVRMVFAALGGLTLAMTILLVAGDIILSMAFRADTSRLWLFTRTALALGVGATFCWAMCSRLGNRLEKLLVRIGDPHGWKTVAAGLVFCVGAALLIPLFGLPSPRNIAQKSGPPAGLQRVETGLRIMLVGVDGATWTVVDDLVSAGSLPVIEQLIEHGTRGTPLSPPPHISPITWTSIVTGRLPDQHGINEYLLVDLPGLSPLPFRSLANDPSILPFSFVALGYFLAGTADGIPPTSQRVRVKSIWHMLADDRQASLLLGMPCSWPAEPLPGLTVTDRFGPTEWDMFSHHEGPVPRSIYPPEAEQRLQVLTVDSNKNPAAMLKRLGGFDNKQIAELADHIYNPMLPAPLSMLVDVYDLDLTFLNILQSEWPQEKYVFAAVLLNGLDLAMHIFWAERYPQDFGRKVSQHPRWGRLIDAFHQLVETRIGEILQQANKDTVVILLSDSGMEASPGNLVWPGWHAEKALFLMSGGPVRSGIELEKVTFQDIVPTILYLLGFPVPDDLTGRVLTDAIKPEFLERFAVRRISSYE